MTLMYRCVIVLSKPNGQGMLKNEKKVLIPIHLMAPLGENHSV